MISQPAILLVEDDENLGYILSEYLKMNEFTVDWAKDGEQGIEFYRKKHFDICILDIMMPKKDGFELAEEIKKRNEKQPIVFLTARALKVDKLKGFRAGCDDYIVKPVDEEELIARIRAIIKRSSQGTRGSATGHFQVGDYFFDYESQTLNYKGDKLKLTEKESEVLRMLCECKGKILDRKVTLRLLWGENDYFTRRSMDVFITKLRKVLRKDPRVKISNVHGRGFVLRD